MQVSTQLQSTVDQVKTLKASLAETTKALEKTDVKVKNLEAELQKSKSDGQAAKAKVCSGFLGKFMQSCVYAGWACSLLQEFLPFHCLSGL